jgi:hypothetical protein
MDLAAVVLHEIQPYAGEMLNGYADLTINPDGQVFTVVSVAKFKGERITHLSLHVRIVGQYVLIEHDDSDEPLADALLRAGIPRAQIIRAYAGEPVPESA